MSERKIVLFILFVAAYWFYSGLVWKILNKENVQDKNEIKPIIVAIDAEINNTDEINHAMEKPKKVIKNKTIPLHYENACSLMEIFTEKPVGNLKKKIVIMDEHDRNTITSIAISMFLLVLIINAILDVIKVKEEERLKKKLNPEGIRRQSLAEFANRRPLRRESSKFGFQLFQIAESNANSEEDRPRRHVPYNRGDSINSYLSDRSRQNEAMPASLNDASGSGPNVFGERPAPMARRCSFPVLPVHPDIQALQLGNRQPSVDSDDEDARGKRVRLIRRF